VKIYEWRQDVIYGPYLARQRSPNVLPCHQMTSHRWRTSACGRTRWRTDWRASSITWTAVRDVLMGEHADIFLQVRAIVKTMPNTIDQMKFFELIQIVPSPIRSALRSPGQLSNSRPDHHEISTEQQHLRLWTGRQGESICDRSRNS
jgi:hypothetical protein